MRYGTRLFTLSACLLTGVAWAADQRAEALASLRVEVEGLSEELALQKEDLRGRLRATDAQAADLEVQIRREELRVQQLRAEVEARQNEAEAGAQAGDAIRPDLEAGLRSVRAEVAASLPYRLDERLAAIDDLAEQLDQGLLSPEQVTARLWAFVEDELRLTRENALDSQVVDIGGVEQLVDVARVGMVALYYRDADGRYGAATARGGGWAWSPVEGEDVQMVESLFDALEKGVRVGWFELPNTFPEPS